jgi:hypothetical protein
MAQYPEYEYPYQGATGSFTNESMQNASLQKRSGGRPSSGGNPYESIGNAASMWANQMRPPQMMPPQYLPKPPQPAPQAGAKPPMPYGDWRSILEGIAPIAGPARPKMAGVNGPKPPYTGGVGDPNPFRAPLTPGTPSLYWGGVGDQILQLDPNATLPTGPSRPPDESVVKRRPIPRPGPGGFPGVRDAGLGKRQPIPRPGPGGTPYGASATNGPGDYVGQLLSQGLSLSPGAGQGSGVTDSVARFRDQETIGDNDPGNFGNPNGPPPNIATPPPAAGVDQGQPNLPRPPQEQAPRPRPRPVSNPTTDQMPTEVRAPLTQPTPPPPPNTTTTQTTPRRLRGMPWAEDPNGPSGPPVLGADGGDYKPPADGGANKDSGQNDYLSKLEGMLRDKFAYEREEGLRSIRSAMYANGFNDSGAGLDMMGDYMKANVAAQQGSLADMLFQSSESEQERRLKEILGRMQADAQTSSASIGANASMYGADAQLQAALAGIAQQQQNSMLDYNLGLYGIGADVYGMGLNNQLGWGNIMAGLGGDQMNALLGLLGQSPNFFVTGGR